LRYATLLHCSDVDGMLPENCHLKGEVVATESVALPPLVLFVVVSFLVVFFVGVVLLVVVFFVVLALYRAIFDVQHHFRSVACACTLPRNAFAVQCL